MSTKSTLAHGPSWHFYREMFEEGTFLQVNFPDIEVTLHLNREQTAEIYRCLVQWAKEEGFA